MSDQPQIKYEEKNDKSVYSIKSLPADSITTSFLINIRTASAIGMLFFIHDQCRYTAPVRTLSSRTVIILSVHPRLRGGPYRSSTSVEYCAIIFPAGPRLAAEADNNSSAILPLGMSASVRPYSRSASQIVLHRFFHRGCAFQQSFVVGVRASAPQH